MSGKYALIIGNTEYTDPGLAQLTAPSKDAEDFARVLKSADIAAFDNVITLINENISKVNEIVDDFFALKKPDDLLVFYFSGHGVRDEYGALYLAIKNTNRARLRSTAIRADYIRESMDQSRSRRQVLILDCCNSGAFAQGTKAETGGTMGTAKVFEGTGYGRVVLTASDATQFAWEGDKVIGETSDSLFTHFLVKGLEGEADQDGDGKITVDELYDYAYEQIVNITPKQTPGKWSYKQQGEIVLRQSTRMENIKPVSLPDQLTSEIENPYPEVRLRAVLQLAKLVSGKNLGLARSAREALERIEKEDDSRRVAQAATQILESTRQAEQLAEQKAEEERKAHEMEEAERIAMQKAEEERIAREKVQQERLAREKAERIAILKAEEERKAKEETQRFAAQKAEEERLVREKIEAERNAQQEAQRLAAQKAKEKRVAREKAEREAAEKAEREAIQLAARRKAEREAADKAVVSSRKTASPQPGIQQQPFLKWAIIAVIGLCVLVTGAWGIRYLANLITPLATPTEAPQATGAPATEMPATEEPTEAAAQAPTSDLKMGVVTDVGQLEDKSFNQAAYEGGKAAAEKLGATFEVIVTQNISDYKQNIQTFVDQGFNVIITVGFLIGTDTTIAAKENPDVKFIGVDQGICVDENGDPDATFACKGDAATLLPNYQGIVFAEEQAGYLAGIVAASISKTGTIDAVGGTNVPAVVAYNAGYVAGAKSVNPDIKTLYQETNPDPSKGFNDPATGKAIAKQFIGQGADVLFQIAGLTGQGVLEAACDAGIYGIGVDVDQVEALPNLSKCIVTSAEKKLKDTVQAVTESTASGDFKAGTVSYNAASTPPAIGLAPYHDLASLITPEIQAKLDDAMAKMQSGELKPPRQ